MYSKRHLLLYYYKYKDSMYFSLSIFVLVLIVAVLLLLKVVIPKMNTWFSINNEVNATKKKIATINDNIRYISSLDENDLVQKRTLVVHALPFDKDFQGILHTISSSATTSNVKLNDYSLSIGELSPKTKSSTLSTLVLTLDMKGSPINIKQFIVQVQSLLPLAEVTSVDIHNGRSSVELTFYYKSLPVFKVSDSEPIQRISGKFDSILSQLQTWSDNTDVQGVSTTASPSATLP